MIDTLQDIQQKVFMIFELSSEGDILYFRNTESNFSSEADSNPVGRSFFETNFFENTDEIWRRSKNFLKGHDAVENFKFALKAEDHWLETRVMLMRVFERSNNERAHSVIVDIRSV
jgi:hypothetical protein